jgi:hypothetical protein
MPRLTTRKVVVITLTKLNMQLRCEQQVRPKEEDMRNLSVRDFSSPIWLLCFVMGVCVLVLLFSPSMLGQAPTANAPMRQATLDVVNVGEDSPPGRLTGFGPPEPATDGGFWGGATGDFYRVVWFPDDEPSAIVELNIPPHSVAQKIEIAYLNGISGCFGSPLGDTFQTYIGNTSNPAVWAFVGTTLWDPSACTVGEQERGVVLYIQRSANEFDVGLGGGSTGKDLFVKIVSSAGLANQPWASFNIFGQVGIHSTKLIGVTRSHRDETASTPRE